MTTVLPAFGAVSLSTIATCLHDAPQRLKVLDRVMVRALFVKNDEKWVHASSLMSVGHEATTTKINETRSAGPLMLFCRELRASEIASPQDLIEAFSWRLEDGSWHSPNFQENVQVRRQRSGGSWGAWPCWILGLYDQTSRQSAQAPHAPFYDPVSKAYADSFGEVLGDWLGDPQQRETSQVTNQYTALVRDGRARFTSLSLREGAKNDQLRVEIEARGVACDMAVVRTDYEGRKTNQVAAVVAGTATVDVPTPFTMLEAVLLDNGTGEWLDEAHDRVMTRLRDGYGDPLDAMMSDLARGECDTVEFKPLISLDRTDSKAMELLKVVTAFANTHGGALYIGISDDAEIIGVSGELYRRGGPSLGVTPEAARAKYAEVLGRLLTQGITPLVRFKMDWVQPTGHHVLRVIVEPGGNLPHQVVETGDYWHRRGATCRKGLGPRHVAILGANALPARDENGWWHR